MSKKWPGGIITPTPATPTGPYETGSAPGIWTLSQQSYWAKQGLWPIAGNLAPRMMVFGAYRTDALGSTNVISYVNIGTTGNDTDFGDLRLDLFTLSAIGSTTRALIGGGYGVSSGYNASNNIDYITVATSGNSTNFGQLTVARQSIATCSNSTRAVFAGGGIPNPDPTNVMDYVTFASTGNATTFGALTMSGGYNGTNQGAGFDSPTRGVISAGYRNYQYIQYITTATTGNGTSFGTLTTGVYNMASFSNSTRGGVAGGYDGNSSVYASIISYVTIATTGNSATFGNLTQARLGVVGGSSETRGVFAGGSISGTTAYNTIDYITIASTGNATDFGDLAVGRSSGGGTSTAHGGLQ